MGVSSSAMATIREVSLKVSRIDEDESIFSCDEEVYDASSNGYNKHKKIWLSCRDNLSGMAEQHKVMQRFQCITSITKCKQMKLVKFTTSWHSTMKAELLIYLQISLMVPICWQLGALEGVYEHRGDCLVDASATVFRVNKRLYVYFEWPSLLFVSALPSCADIHTHTNQSATSVLLALLLRVTTRHGHTSVKIRAKEHSK